MKSRNHNALRILFDVERFSENVGGYSKKNQASGERNRQTEICKAHRQTDALGNRQRQMKTQTEID
eukprot:1443889-Rhodomonas_salina.3